MYYWIWALHEGRLVVDGWFATEEEAYEQMLSKGGDFKVHASSSRDRRVATSEIKHKVWEQTSDLDQALKRAKHYVNEEAKS